ncbi:hypothetical protein AAC387_Pa02g4458 [Persea americana]
MWSSLLAVESSPPHASSQPSFPTVPLRLPLQSILPTPDLHINFIFLPFVFLFMVARRLGTKVRIEASYQR